MEEQKFYQLYEQYFVKGYNEYNSLATDETIDFDFDVSKISTIAYLDGFNFAENCEITHRTLGMRDENFIANLNIYYHRAIDVQTDYHDLYLQYADGFLEGYKDTHLAIPKSPEDLSKLEEEKKSYLEGYQDGSQYYQNSISKNEQEINLEKLKTESVIREKFQLHHPSFTHLILRKKVNENRNNKTM